MTYIKEKIVSFLKCILRCERSATQEEIQAAKHEIDLVKKSAYQSLKRRLGNYTAFHRAFFATVIEASSLMAQISFLSDEMMLGVTPSKLKSNKAKIFDLCFKLYQVKPVHNSTPELEKTLREFSLEQMQLSNKYSSSEFIVEVIKGLHCSHEKPALEVVNAIRAEKNMPPVSID